jgi:type I restriction enzyme S subunit
MGLGWLEYTLGDLCKFKYGHMPRKTDLCDDGYPVFSGYHVVGHATTYHYEEPEIIVVARGVGGTGDVKMSPPKCFLTNLSIVAQVVSSEVDKKFLYYRLAGPKLWELRTGSAQAQITIDRLQRYELRLPPLPTQRKIAAILSAYDDLIENNLRRIKILEEMVQNLYREWFVKFRFPGHQHVCLTDSPLGRIPEGWEVASISDVAIIYRGRSYKGTELAEEGGRPFVNLKCIERDGGFRSSGLKRYTGPFKDMHTVRAGEMVMAITDMTQERRIVARVGRVSRLDADFGVISMDLVRVASRGNLSETYLYAMLRWSGFADEVKQHANGVNVLHLLPDRIEEYRFVCPTSGIAAGFGEVALPMLSLCDSLEQRNATLHRTRDLLLPRLISGELDVSSLNIAVSDGTEA